MIGCMVFAPPEPQAHAGTLDWEAVLPANYSVCTLLGYFSQSQAVYTDPIPAYCALGVQQVKDGEWRQGWSFFSWYFYYVKISASGEETVINAQSVYSFFGEEYRLWRGDQADGPVLTVKLDYWAEPWLQWDRVQVYDVYHDTDHIARMTETVPHSMLGYGGATAEFSRISAEGEKGAPLATMTQPPLSFTFFGMVPQRGTPRTTRQTSCRQQF